MELTGKQTIAQSKERVWLALNDPGVLRQCIPGCSTFELIDENLYQIEMVASVGPVKAKFHGKLRLTDIVPTESYALSFDGSGGAAGFGKGSAAVRLTEEGQHTDLQYSVNAKVGGRLAQVGARLIDGVAKKMADEFFSRFKGIVDPADADASIGPVEHLDARVTPKLKRNLLRGLSWSSVLGAIVVVVVGYLLYKANGPR